MEFNKVLRAYALDAEDCTVTPFGTGLINRTWKLTLHHSGRSFVLQQINTAVFIHPQYIAENIRRLANYLGQHHPNYLFMAPLPTTGGDEMYFEEGIGYFRLFPFLEGSRSFDVVTRSQQAYEAARQFGLFTRLLSGFEANQLKITLPDFHNLTLRFNQFKQALAEGNPDRIRQSKDAIDLLLMHEPIVQLYEALRTRPEFRIRVTHSDTKISNVLFNQNDQGLCVIDLDTVMPGYFISDVGDMLRTYLSTASEEERDFSRIDIREDIFSAIVQGYLREMYSDLSELERSQFVFSGKFMIYMQALRFLTDHLNNDIYYGAKYEGHNLIRAKNQLVLLQRLVEKEAHLEKLVIGYAVAGR